MTGIKHQTTETMPHAVPLAMAMTGLTAIMTETLSAGLLPSITANLHVSPASAGQSVTACAADSLIAAIPLTAITQEFERRAVLLAAVLVSVRRVFGLAESVVISWSSAALLEGFACGPMRTEAVMTGAA